MKDETTVTGSPEPLGTSRDARQAACSDKGRWLDRPRISSPVSTGCASCSLLQSLFGVLCHWFSFILNGVAPSPFRLRRRLGPHPSGIEVTAKARRGGPFCRA